MKRCAREIHDLRREVEALGIQLRNVARTIGFEVPGAAGMDAEEAAEEAVATIRDLRFVQSKGGK